MLPGVSIAMGGQDWIVPALTLGQLRRLMPKIKQLTHVGADMAPEQILIMTEVVAAALQRNYPDITEERVENELLDLGNAHEVVRAIMTGSGLKPRPETAAVATSSGDKFTGSSLPPADMPTP
jgi:hypothetical protein